MAWVEYDRDDLPNGGFNGKGTAYLRCTRCKKTCAVPLYKDGTYACTPTPCSCEAAIEAARKKR